MPYPLPEVLEPEDTICVQIWIPNDLTYIKNFRGHIHELTRWFNHERNEDHDAKVVAMQWMYAFLGMTIGECGTMTDNCCPETNEILSDIRGYLAGGFLVTPNLGQVGGTGSLPECAPDKFGGNEGDNEDEFERRKRALCYVLRNMFADAIARQFERLHMKGSAVSKFYQAVNAIKTEQSPLWQGDTVIYMKSADLDALVSNSADFDTLICHTFANWLNEDLAFETFAAGLDGFTFTDPPENLIDRMFFVLFNFLSYSKNFTLFGEALDTGYQKVGDNPELGEDCTCDPILPCGIFTQPYGANFGNEYPATPITQIGVNKFRFHSTPPTSGSFMAVYGINFDSVGCFVPISIEIVFLHPEAIPPTLRDNGSLGCDDVSGAWIVENGCYKSALLSYANHDGEPSNYGEFYVDIEFGDCCDE